MNKSQVNEKINRLCADKNISVAELSTRSGFSESQIDSILKSETVPSLAVLLKISRALGVRLGTLLDDSDTLGPIVNTLADNQQAVSFSSQLSKTNSHLDFYTLAAGKANRHMEPFIIDIQPSLKEEPILSTHEGEEFIYVLEGVVKITYGKNSYSLSQGESMYYDSIVPHLVASGNEAAAKILAVVYSPF